MRTLLFGAHLGPDLAAVEASLKRAEPFIDGLELRLDAFSHIDLDALRAFLRKTSLPIMLTLRRHDQGGFFKGSEKERLKLLETLCELKPAYVDLEWDVPEEFRRKLFEAHFEIVFLSSFHDFSSTPVDLETAYQKINTPYAHIYKIAITAQSTLDALQMLAFVQKHSHEQKMIGIAMGEEGEATRILAPVVGCCLTYAALSSEESTAPGQLTAQELQTLYRFRSLNRHTQVYGVIGDPVDKSLGAIVHNAVFSHADLNAVYLKMRVIKEELAAFISLARALPFEGFSVTMPHKETILPLLDQLSDDTQAIGACNTIVIEKIGLKGENTDGIGSLNALERVAPVAGKHMLVVGAGGAAKALTFEAMRRGASVTIINRTAKRAIEIAKTFGCRGGGWELFPEVCANGYDILVNCIPESDQIEEQWILPETLVMDMVYIPKHTPLLNKAKQKKCRIVFGNQMFAEQALEQERIWFADAIDAEAVFQIIQALV